MTDDYELLPHEEIARLKREIQNLKNHSPVQPQMNSSIENLTYSINSMLGIFKEAAEEMKLDEHDAGILSDRLNPLMNKIDKILDQNEKIAKGIVAIADMIDDLKNNQSNNKIHLSNMDNHPPQNSMGNRIDSPQITQSFQQMPPPGFAENSMKGNSQPQFSPSPYPQAKPLPQNTPPPVDNSKKKSKLFDISFK